jgi:hypothetical protein
MALTYTLIASNLLSSNTATITFSSIPSTYTDLVLKFSGRSNAGSDYTVPVITFNNLGTSIYSYTLVSSNNNSIFGYTQSSVANGGGDSYVPGATSTASTFGSYEIYIPSYNSSTNKPYTSFAVAENNSATSYDIQGRANQFGSTAAINRIDIALTSFVSGSSFYLYGIKNS